MKGTTNLIMLLTLVLLVSLAMVLGLVLLLVAELYCSPLLRRRRNRHRQVETPNATLTGDNPSIHSQSTLTSILHPVNANGDIEKQLTPNQSPENYETGRTQLQEMKEIRNEPPLVYISNPVFDGESGRRSRAEDGGTPFETPETSPSRLETEEESSGDDEREEISSEMVVDVTPPLTPMKKLPAEAVSVCLKDARSLGSSGSDTNSNNGASSSSLTPCTSPSL